MRRLAIVILAAALATTSLCSAAHGDGDPASDILIGVNVFFPYSPAVSPPLQRTLNSITLTAKRSGFPIKVALIESASDLGAVPSLFNKPQQYASFLDQEISLIGSPHPPLLVVMPDGYGTAGLPIKDARAAQRLARPGADRSNGLAQAAIRAIERLATVAGHPMPALRATAPKSAGGRSPVLVAAIIAAAIAAAALIAARRGLLQRRG